MGQSHPLRRAQLSGAEIWGPYLRGVPSATALFSGLPFVFAVEHGEGEGERG